MNSFTDQLGQTIILNQIPKRIISLVPSQTELLYELGLSDEIIGITKFCIHPQSWFQTKTRIGGTKKLNFDTIHQLQPDLIIANKEENTKAEIEELANHFPVWVSDVNNLTQAFEMIHQIGIITGKSEKASEIVNSIKRNFGSIQKPSILLKTVYLIWQEPYMTIGGDTFINEMLEMAGYENCFKNESRYPEITLEQIQNSSCDVLMLSSEPYPFGQKHVAALQPLLPSVKIMLVDGEMFSWYGSRLMAAPAYFNRLNQALASD